MTDFLRPSCKLLFAGLIEESGDRPAPAHDDERRRYYQVSAFGRRVLKAEAERLDRLVRQARSQGLLGDKYLPHTGRAR